LGNWNLKEFKQICLQKEFNELLHYTESLAFKWQAAIYHKDNIEEKINGLQTDFSLEKAARYDYEIIFEADALLTVLNSMWDILAQIINECFIHKEIKKVYFCTILVNNHNLIPAQVKSYLVEIEEAELYKTIKAYCNTSKHRYAVRGNTDTDVSKKPYDVKFIVDEFEYNGKRYKLTQKKVLECYKFAGKSFDTVGNEIHKLLKSGDITKTI